MRLQMLFSISPGVGNAYTSTPSLINQTPLNTQLASTITNDAPILPPTATFQPRYCPCHRCNSLPSRLQLSVPTISDSLLGGYHVRMTTVPIEKVSTPVCTVFLFSSTSPLDFRTTLSLVQPSCHPKGPPPRSAPMHAFGLLGFVGNSTTLKATLITERESTTAVGDEKKPLTPTVRRPWSITVTLPCADGRKQQCMGTGVTARHCGHEGVLSNQRFTQSLWNSWLHGRHFKSPVFGSRHTAQMSFSAIFQRSSLFDCGHLCGTGFYPVARVSLGC
jgi:hypothetical protein